ncbi:MAG: hypothetical protein AAFV86_09600 [Pseudomonadota bacterium]
MRLTSETFLTAMIDDAAGAIAAATEGPPDIVDHAQILFRLENAAEAFPPLYRGAMQAPLASIFRAIGRPGWHDVLRRDPQLQGIGLLGLDLVQSITQRQDGTEGAALAALQEMVSDLYDGFLSDADRKGVHPPDHSVIPPLIKWGRPNAGPYAWTAPATASYGCGAGVVNMPSAFARRGLAAWSALGHETAGHQILHADEGLHDDLAAAVHQRIQAASGEIADAAERAHLAAYWADRIDESASDVMGIVNMGPAAATGLLAYFRALGLLRTGERRLSAFGPAGGEHPAPLARGYLMAAALGLCSFEQGAGWKAILDEEVDADAPDQGASLAGRQVSKEMTRVSAGLAAEAILTAPMNALEGHALVEIQDWREHDHRIVQLLTLQVMMGGRRLSPAAHDVVFAAHAVAAAVNAALINGDLATAHARMIETTAAMHATNAAWSPLVVGTPGNVEHPHVIDDGGGWVGAAPPPGPALGALPMGSDSPAAPFRAHGPMPVSTDPVQRTREAIMGASAGVPPALALQGVGVTRYRGREKWENPGRASGRGARRGDGPALSDDMLTALLGPPLGA